MRKTRTSTHTTSGACAIDDTFTFEIFEAKTKEPIDAASYGSYPTYKHDTRYLEARRNTE